MSNTITLNEALGLGRDLTLNGEPLRIDPLDFADLADLETALASEPLSDQENAVIEALKGANSPGAENYQNPLSRLRPFSIAHQLLILHLCLRKSRPGITRTEAAALISARQYQKPETTAFLTEMLLVSGVMSGDPEPAEKASEAASTDTKTEAKQTTPKKATTRRASSSV